MIGTIIHGTHRNEDLIPAFVDALTERLEDAALNCPKGNEVEMAKAIGDAHETLGAIERRMEGGEDYFLSEDAMWDLEWLFDALNEFAPEGTHFGAHEGDGADFGFWPIEEDEEEGAAIYGAYDEDAGF